MKKLICLLLTLLLMVSPVTAFAYYDGSPPESSSGTYYNFDWSYDADTRTLYFSDNGGKRYQYPYYRYNSVGDDSIAYWYIDFVPQYSWFTDGRAIAQYAENVVFDSSVTEIINYQCKCFYSLKSVTIPDSVKRIGGYAFAQCPNLKEFTLPQGIEEYYIDSFSTTGYARDESNNENGCYYVDNYLIWQNSYSYGEPISIKKGTTHIPNYAFDGYKQSEITLPESLERIGEYAFNNSNIESITIPARVSEINFNIFEKCSNLKSINALNDNYYCVDGVVLSGDKTELLYYPAGREDKTYTVPSTVKRIKTGFSGLSNLGYLIIPKTVESLDVKVSSGLTCYYMGVKNYKLLGYITRGRPFWPTNIKCCTLKHSDLNFTYDKKVHAPRIKLYAPNGKKLKKGTDYKLSAPKNTKKLGVYTVKAKLIGKYKGSFSVTYTISPVGTKLKKISATDYSATVRWKKQSKNTTGYQIQYCRNKNFTQNVKTVTVKGKNKTSCIIDNLDLNKRYYVRIRTYKKVKGKKAASEWSSVKSFKTAVQL